MAEPLYPLHMLTANPWIGATYTRPHLIPAAEHLARAANGAVAHLLVRPTWVADWLLKDYREDVRAIAQTAPNLRLTFAASTAEDDRLYRDAGFSSIWCSHNAFVDETLFKPVPVDPKLYDAVYVGRLAPEKRIELAAQTPRLALVTGRYNVSEPYASACLAACRDLAFVNYDVDSGVKWIPPHEVHDVLARSRCGLALSPVEGAMYGSMEYLLSGLPVVTTPSQGGRDVFFHPDYVETVDPDAEAVAAGVARIIARRLDPEMIRKRTIELIKPHRARLLMWLSGIVQQSLFPAANANLWLPSFANKLETWIYPTR